MQKKVNKKAGIVKPRTKAPNKVIMSASIKPATVAALRKMAEASNTTVSDVMGSLLDFAISFDTALKSTNFNEEMNALIEPYLNAAVSKMQGKPVKELF